jgi:hypothetical protein
MTPLPSQPAPPGRRLILGLTRPQMAFAFLSAVFVYMAVTFLLPGLTAPLWRDLTWRDALTFLTLLGAWVGIAVYNRRHPDEEIRLNLDA